MAVAGPGACAAVVAAACVCACDMTAERVAPAELGLLTPAPEGPRPYIGCDIGTARTPCIMCCCCGRVMLKCGGSEPMANCVCDIMPYCIADWDKGGPYSTWPCMCVPCMCGG